MKKLLIAILIFATAVPAAAIDRIIPDQDLHYDGAFIIPNTNTINPTQSTVNAGRAMAYNPDGNGGAGSLYVTCHHIKTLGVAEINIPTPQIESTWSALPQATFLTTCNDITGGIDKLGGIIDSTRTLGMVIMPAKGSQTTPKIYHTYTMIYQPQNISYPLAWSDTNLSSPNTQGWWRLSQTPPTADDPIVTADYAMYALEIDQDWANANTGGKSLGVGMDRGQGGGSFGPTLYAISPWASGNPPPASSTIPYKKLLGYSQTNPIPNFSNGERPEGAAWLKINNKQAFVVFGIGFSRYNNEYQSGLMYYGDPIWYGSGSKGYNGEPYFMKLMFFDTNDLAAVAAGTKESWEVVPYAKYNLVDHEMRPGAIGPQAQTRKQMGGMTYDKVNNKIYIGETAGGGNNRDMMVVHVYSLQDVGTTINTTPPDEPSNIAFDPATNTLSWDAVTGAKWYKIYRRIPVKVGQYGTGIYEIAGTVVQKWVQDAIDAGDIVAGAGCDNAASCYRYTSNGAVVYEDYPMALSTTNSWIDTKYTSFTYHEYKVTAMDNLTNESGISQPAEPTITITNSALSGSFDLQ